MFHLEQGPSPSIYHITLFLFFYLFIYSLIYII